MKKTSVTDIQSEIEKIKKDFNRTKSTISPEGQMVFTALFSIVNLLLIAFVNKFSKNNSRNSSIPPSQDPHRKRKEKNGNVKNGAPYGHRGTTLLPVKDPDEVIVLTLDNCEGCGRKLHHKHKEFEKRQVFDIKIQTWVTEYQSHKERCSCGCLNQGKFPDDVNAPVQYGNKVKALAVYMNQYQLIPLDRTAEFFSDQMNLPVNKSSINNWTKEVASKLIFFEEEAKDDLINSMIIHGDETGVIIEKKNTWLHCLSNEHTTLYTIGPGRGCEAMDEVGILPLFNGYLVHDFWCCYFQYDCIHVMCNPHILRELTHALEIEKQKWASKLKKLLSNSLLKRDDSPSGLSWKQIQFISQSYDRIIKNAESECPINRQISGKRRGRKAQSKSRNLLERLKKHKSSILMFLYSKDIPFSNNQGERDLRMIKVHQKISGCFRTLDGARNFCRIRSYISTMKKRGCAPEEALAAIFARGS